MSISTLEKSTGTYRGFIFLKLMWYLVKKSQFFFPPKTRMIQIWENIILYVKIKVHTFLSLCSIVFQVLASRLVRSCLVGSPSPDVMIWSSTIGLCSWQNLKNGLAGLFGKLGSFFSEDLRLEFFFPFGVSTVPCWFYMSRVEVHINYVFLFKYPH